MNYTKSIGSSLIPTSLLLMGKDTREPQRFSKDAKDIRFSLRLA